LIISILAASPHIFLFQENPVATKKGEKNQRTIYYVIKPVAVFHRHNETND